MQKGKQKVQEGAVSALTAVAEACSVCLYWNTWFHIFYVVKCNLLN
jgi:hypothetical protein